MTDPDVQEHPIDESLRRRFESAWIAGRPEPIEGCLPGDEDPRYAGTLEELVHIELEFAWRSWSKQRQAGSTAPLAETVVPPPSVESYLERFPVLTRPEVVSRLVEQECVVRRETGNHAPVDEYRRRFPDLVVPGGPLESLLSAAGSTAAGVGLEETTSAGRPGGGSAGRICPGRFGNYELLEELGRGGMGVVYRARQCSADRIVALKVIRGDRLDALPRDSQMGTVDRFRHEAQAAARLEHENIVTVYEVGEVEGEPFFSMRYVEGRSLTEILHDGPISNRQAAAYMEPVARAVQEAHALGILHRDLKPQNILVDEKLDRPMVADFGLAKLMESNEELTCAGEVMGSPPYMSPEQAQDSSRVAPQTDVYALGATLYHILTGRPPFQAATPLETLRQVIEFEPVPPRQLNQSIDRDLDTICIKCLQKEPARRYGSAELLADDLRRYLNGEPIRARPIGPFQRAVRWCRRNPAVATLLTSTVTFLVLALVATGVGYVTAETARRQSDASYRQARGAVDNFYTQVSEDTLLNQPGMQPLRRKLLEDALRYYQNFLAQRGNDPTIRDELALTHFRTAQITEQIDSPKEALASYRRALAMQRQLLAERPADPQRLEAVGDTLTAMGRALSRQGKLDEARIAHEEAAIVRRRLVEAAPDDCELQRTLANSYMNIGIVQRESGRADQARRRLEEAQAVRKRILGQGCDAPEIRRDLGMGHYNLAVLASSMNDYPAADENFTEAIAAFEDLLNDQPEDLANQYRLVVCYRLLADLKCATSDPDAAGVLYEKALERQEALARSNPAVPEYQSALAGLHMNLGLLQYEQGRPETAMESFEEAVAILDELVGQYPEVPHYRCDLAVTLRQIASIEAASGRNQAARDNLETALKHLRVLAKRFPENREYASRLAETEADLGGL